MADKKPYYECPKCHAHLDSIEEACDCDGPKAPQPEAAEMICAAERTHAVCPRFRQRYDIGRESGIGCVGGEVPGLSAERMTGEMTFGDRAERDAYYRTWCCGDNYKACLTARAFESICEKLKETQR